jgi:hypothetical protein
MGVLAEVDVEVEEITASSTFGTQDEYGPHFAIDGILSSENRYFLHTNDDTYSWVQIELSQPQMVAGVELFNRADCCGDRLRNLEIRAGFDPVPEGTTGDVLLTQNARVGYFPGPGVNGGTYEIMFATSQLVQFITLQLTDRNYLHFNEVKVIAGDNNEEKEGKINSYCILVVWIIPYILKTIVQDVRWVGLFSSPYVTKSLQSRSCGMKLRMIVKKSVQIWLPFPAAA